MMDRWCQLPHYTTMGAATTGQWGRQQPRDNEDDGGTTTNPKDNDGDDRDKKKNWGNNEQWGQTAMNQYHNH
jgi:hypothetical protein